MDRNVKYVLYLALPLVIIAGAYVVYTYTGGSGGQLKTVNLRLQWVPQTQFAGYLTAQEKGFYEENGLEINIRPGGPDLKPQSTVSSGSDEFGIGVSNQVITARSNGVPLVAIAQLFQDSANRYVLKSKNRISSLRELKGKEVGLWLGGDEVEFLSMLRKEEMSSEDIEIVSQGFSVSPFLEGEYVLSQVTVYNELNQIEEKYPRDSLQILSPSDYDSAIVSDMIFTTESYINNNSETVAKFLQASLRGWKYAMNNPSEAVEIALQRNSELTRKSQREQLRAVTKLILSGQASQKGIGYIDPDDYRRAERILYQSDQIDSHVNIQEAYNLDPWKQVEEDAKMVNPKNIPLLEQER